MCWKDTGFFFFLNIKLYFSRVILCFRLNYILLQKLNHLKFAFYPHEPHFNTLQGWPGCLEEFHRQIKTVYVVEYQFLCKKSGQSVNN